MCTVPVHFVRHDHQLKGNHMNTVRKNIVIALAALSMGGVVVAAEQQAQAPQGQQRPAVTQEQRAATMAEQRAKRAEHMAKRQAELHDALKLSASQEQAWASFVASHKPAEHAQRPDRAQWAGLSAPQRMEKMIEMQKQRTTRMEERLAALNTFYATLTPEQKKVFDQQSMRHHGMRGHHGMHGSHRGHAMQG
jgi:Spy/CpxP family protein refolding chaperone